MIHKDMMGFGYLGNGGLSLASSSNLSPLAPPFTVDRSNPKSNSNTPSNFTEIPPPYGAPFSSSLRNWQYPQSSAPGADYSSICASEIDSVRTTYLPSAKDYCYLGSEPINPSSVHWAPPNPNTTDPTSNPFSYGGAPKQYYPPYASQVVDDNGSLGLRETNYDLLSTSGLVPMVGSSQVDYNQGLSSLEFPSPWGGYWNGLPEGKRGKRTDIDGSFHLEETQIAGSHAYRDYLKQGVVPVEVTQVRCEENPTATQKKYVDGCGKEKNAGFLAKEQLDDNFGRNLEFSPDELSKACIFGTGTMFRESHLESPSLEPVTFSSNHHKSYSPYEKGFQLFDSCINDCISVAKTSVMPVIRPPIFGTKFPVSNTVASKSMDVWDVTNVNKKDVTNYNQALEKEPLLPPSSVFKEDFLDANHLSFHTGRNDQRISAATSSSKVEMLTKPLSKNSLDRAIKVRGGQIPVSSVPHGFTLSVDSTEAFMHTANTTESSDQHNPAEDSPCWKGAPASNVSPFESSKAMLPQNLMKNLEAHDCLDFEAAQMFPPYNGSVMDFSGEVCGLNLRKESLSMDNSKSVSKEHLAADAGRSKSDSVQQNRNDGDQYSSNVENQIKQYNLLNMSKSDSCSVQSQTKQLCPEKVNFTSRSKIQLQAGDVDAGISTCDTSEDGCIPLHAVENVLCSPPSEVDDGKQYNLLNVLKCDSGSIQSQTKQLCPKKVNCTSKSKIQLQACDVDAGSSTSDTSENGCIPLHAVEHVLCSPPSEVDDGKPPAVESSPKMNVQILANALHNISELLVLYSSDDEWALKEQDSKTLEHAIHNINVCLSKKIVKSTPRQESMFPREGISHIHGEGATMVRLHAMNEVGNTTVGQLDSYSTHEHKRIYSVSDKKFEKNMEFVSSRNDADVTWHHNMVQNIKKVLDGNFQSEEDISSETLLYKNLWLNAEAELCVTGLKSRFDQVKIQMENRKSEETKEDSVVVDEIPSSNASPDPILDVVSGFTPEANVSPKQKSSVQCSCILSPSDGNDVEASVMARFQILKRRGDTINTSVVEEKSLPDVVQPDVTDFRVPWQIVGSQTGNKSFDVAVGSRIQRHNDRNIEKSVGSSSSDPQHEAVEEFSVHVSGDPTTIQPYRNIRMHNQLVPGPGWYENTSSDWEHVLKEDFALQT